MRRIWVGLLLVIGCGQAETPPPGPYPFDLSRPEAGEPVSDAERTAVTELYLSTLQDLRYFETVERRMFGWPKNDPEGRPWYGSWWSGIRIERQGTNLVFHQSDDGADNNGLRTGALLEGACYALALWNRPQDAELVQLLTRGFTANIWAMERASDPAAPVMLTRAFYPQSITYEDRGLTITIDNDNQHPGLDNGATEYVHLPDNPRWGDIYVKNKRSKDDIGHMFRAIGALESCRSLLSDEAKADDAVMIDRYRAWARQVEDDNFSIATWDKNLVKWIPSESLAYFVQLLDTDCNAMMMLRLFGRGDTGGRNCGNGVREADELAAAFNDHVRHIFLSLHEAAVQHTLRAGLVTEARDLAAGLALRSDKTHDALEAGEPPAQHDPRDFAGDLAHAANAGVPLNWREVRTLHAAIRAAHDGFATEANAHAVQAFDLDAADGDYSYDLGGDGFNFRDLGVLLGSCASKWKNPDSKPVLDCDLVRAAAID